MNIKIIRSKASHSEEKR